MKGLRKKHNKQQQQTIKKIRQGENKQQKIRFKLKHAIIARNIIGLSNLIETQRLSESIKINKSIKIISSNSLLSIILISNISHRESGKN